MSSPTKPQPPRGRFAPPTVATVEQVERLSPGLIRIVLGGEQLAGFGVGEYTDHYIKLHLPPQGADYTAPFDANEIRESHAKEWWPRTRTYTVRSFDPSTNRLTVDFVVHGDEGIAGPWAARVQPGERVQFNGPGGGYAPDPTITHHLLVGDEAVLPAIAASLERLPASARAIVIAQVPAPGHEIPLSTDADLDLVWLHGWDAEPVLEAVGAAEFPAAETQAFVHGEATMVRLVRRHLAVERGLPLERLSASGYWKQSRDDEAWREEKREWMAQANADVAGVA